jgi:hypothetical protein
MINLTGCNVRPFQSFDTGNGSEFLRGKITKFAAITPHWRSGSGYDNHFWSL